MLSDQLKISEVASNEHECVVSILLIAKFLSWFLLDLRGHETDGETQFLKKGELSLAHILQS